MCLRYPVILKPDDNDTLTVRFPDIPQVITYGVNEFEALYMAQDALVTLFCGLMEDQQPIPHPSKPKKDQPTVSLPPLVTAKLAIYQAMRDQGVSEAEMCTRLHCDLRHIRRLLDLDHETHLKHIEAALAELGKRLTITIQDAA